MPTRSTTSILFVFLHPLLWLGSSARRVTLTIGALLLVLLGMATLSASSILYNWATDDWQEDIDNLSLVLSENAAQAMASSTLVLDDISQLSRAGAKDERTLHAAASNPAISQMMRDKISGLPQISGAAIVAADGNVLALTRTLPASGINVSDRDYYLYHAGHNTDEIFYSTAVRNRTSQAWTFYLSRRINDARGNMVGIALVAISSDFFTNFFKSISLEKHVSIALFGSAHNLLAGWPQQTVDSETNKVAARDETKTAPANRLLAGIRSDTPDISSQRTVRRTPMSIKVSITESGFR